MKNNVYLSLKGSEECGELAQILCKVAMHDHHPSFNDLSKMEGEIGDVLGCIEAITEYYKLDTINISVVKKKRLKKIKDTIQK